MITKMKRKKPLTGYQRIRRWRAKKKAKLAAQKEADRRAKRVEINDQLVIHRLAITEITDVDLASNSVDAVITDPPYAKADVPLYGELAHFAMRVLKPSGWWR
jgi:16S rRNA G966 N2-methylase RsmD